ncbi:MAG: S1 family peptidase [Burkholderiales bacterium]|nr:MAG: S1 family peptidase [Burkholderiales bacterium]
MRKTNSKVRSASTPLALVAMLMTGTVFGADVDPALRSAMKRDLGLSGVQLAQYLKIERLAESQGKALRGQQGPNYAGSWIEKKADGEYKFIVATTSIAPQKAAAGVEIRQVRHKLADLEIAKARLDDVVKHGGKPPQGVYSWHVDPQTNSVVIGLANHAQDAAINFVAASATDSRVIRLETMAEAPRLMVALQGGNEYIASAGGQGGFYCSVGFSVTQAGSQGFATAGHCSDGEAGWGVFVAGGRRQPSVRVGTFTASTMPDDNETGPDRAWVTVDSGHTLSPSVYGYGAGDVAVRGSTEAPIGTALCRSGRTTGWHCGAIRAKNVTVSYSDASGNPDGTVTSLTQTTACAEGGDSGGSFITSTGQGQGVLSGGSGSCKGRQGQNGGGNTYFSPLNPILQTYGLTLKTSL